MNQATPTREAVLDRDLQEVIRLWSADGLRPGTVIVYRHWISNFRRYCQRQRLEELGQLTLAGVRTFAQWYARHRRIYHSPAQASARSALQAWSNALATSGIRVPPWKSIEPPPPVRTPIVREFIEHRRRHADVSSQTLQQDQSTGLEFLEFLRRRKRTHRTVRLVDVDAFAARLRRRMGVVALAARLCSVRALLRFLHVSGKLPFDLAGSVVGPSHKTNTHPPKALPWPKVRRILRAVDCRTPAGRRDYAILLLMSLYGLGGAEVIALHLESIYWDRKILCVCRPKTQSTIILPLLPAAAQALASYLQHGRPKTNQYRQIFLRSLLPYRPFTDSSAIAHILTKYGLRAGVATASLGSHVLRHSQATRQVELGTPLKLVGDILGHRYPETTSGYTRSAVRRLRDLALPLPHG